MNQINKKDIVIGLIILALLAGAIYYLSKKASKPKVGELPSITTTEEKIEEAFRLEIPDNVDKAELKDVTGGTGSGLATRIFENNRFTHTVLVDLPDPEAGSFYQGWLVKGSQYLSTGRLRTAKGGWLLEFESGIDYSDYDQVVITLETKADATPETHILEGSF